jgi:hypothetical protein
MLSPRVAFDGTNYLVVWEVSGYVEAARVRPNGTVLDPHGFLVTSYQARQPDVAFDGENFLVVWTDRYSDYGFGTRIAPSGQVLDTGRIRLTWGDWVTCCRRPRVAFDGENYVLVWEDDWSRANIKGTLVSPEMVKLDSFELTPPTEWGLSSPCLAFAPGSPGILACAGRTAPGMPWDTLSRIHATLLGLPVGQEELGVEPEASGPKLVVRPAHFRRSVRISVQPGIADPDVRVLDASGRCVRNLRGAMTTTWHGRDDYGRALPPGIYIVELQAQGVTERAKVVKVE